MDVRNCEDFVQLEVGNIVYISGTIVTARDKAHMRVVKLIKDGRIEDVPEEMFLHPVYHCGPLLKNGKIVSAGPTTSARMDPYAPVLLRESSCPVIIGKGGMGRKVVDLLKGRGCYLSFPGGAGALAAESIKRIKKVYWQDLGMAEAVYVLEVEKFGPCIVSIDSRGNSIYSI
jgi:fumarate hydratase subunit beta